MSRTRLLLRSTPAGPYAGLIDPSAWPSPAAVREARHRWRGVTAVDAHLVPVVAMLEEAFPGGIADEDRLPLLAVLSEGLNEWNTGVVGSAFLGVEHHRVMNDAARPLSRAQRERAGVLRRRLAGAGWDPDED
ncbi:hypothetical protein ACXZ65_12910 [Streptomyces aculeolatus]